ncbi:hypothetical protein HBI56_064520 [Parastagonospora nodorum]|uniref:DUF6546 domain-containing protein n=2 Tax=Phaeosphaeria nodorum (strain SN15 / ATCC MYA-4574 / FGSC 10173) TaxID=321614 RepID=A0A7U2F307_PHANO|nr:hypothetical protein SNOG_08501 [Parastagonospora nodorum SN15]KAH3906902.1 hypothetical protein HBH56_199020 [Parastagonospora nodorum]EAT83669.1 hypothetical protein SNOG_08501 [Parastagonospora nodorum SN15]KAH3924683.1 hypothetical protein HBH54_191980 [Parastagonospora nodorum]KAH3938621.1 hypothetical protein HBH53_248150 [Parastagonospora nodorum]KAH3957814.1 hypothetical protein HBH51_219780 [Parastagonospora nodorum]
MTKRHDHIAFPWLSLPADICLLVLDEISGQKHRGWAQCAAVCKEWQAILEPKNFSQLALEPSCLDNLETLVIRQRPLVQHICLNIDLPGYTCRSCERSDTMSSRRPTIFRRAILRLFSILSTWQPTGRLTLELSASSPSDSQHWFKNYCFGSGHEDTRDWTQQEKAINWHDPKHGWVYGQQVKTPDLPAFMRLFSPLCLNVPQNLPVVHAVTSFCIRRQLRHELFPQVLKALWDKLPRLESIVYELWRARRHYCQIACAYELAFLFQRSVPKHVKSISIFKDFNNQLALALNNATPHLGRDIETTSAVDLALAKAFAAKSRHLEHLSISYMIDAQHFFTSCQQLPCTWNILQSLTLTSSTLARTVPPQNIYTLLQNASSIALKMPKLKTMVLWNSESGQACAVIYQKHTASARATLTWRGTWNLEFSDDVVESWKKVAPGSCYLRLEKEALRDRDIRSHGDAIHHLRLPDGVVDSASLCQIRHEGMMQRMA